MPVKNTPSKKIKPGRAASRTTRTEDDIAVPISATKSRSPLELDEHDTLTHIDEKPEADPLLPEEESDEFSTDDMGIEDEIDPFGDKWEA